MIKKEITYTNFDGEEVTETFHFHLSRSEIAKLELTHEGVKKHIEALVAAKNNGEVLEIFDKIIRQSIGRRIGNKFVKNADIISDFVDTGAYDVLFMEFLTADGYAATFVNGIMPANIN